MSSIIIRGVEGWDYIFRCVEEFEGGACQQAAYLPSAALKRCVVGLLAFRCVETMAAEWLVGIFFSEEHQLVTLGKTV